MYTAEQYERAQGLLDAAPPDARKHMEMRIAEYESANLRPGEARGAAPEKTEPKGLTAADLPPDTEAFGVKPQLDTTRNADLPSASGLIAIHAPPERKPSQAHSTIAAIAKATLGDPLDGPSATTFFEPSEQQFHKDMAPVLEAKGVHVGTPEYKEAYDEYRDRKWQQAYQQAEAEDRPLVRAAFVDNDPGPWAALKKVVRAAPDVLSAFAKGYASGATMHATDAATGLSDAVTGRNDVGADREQANRDPIAHGLGEFVGSVRTGGGLAKLTHGVAGAAEKYLPGAIGRFAGAALGGAAAGEADLATRSGAQAIGDVAHGESTQSAKDNFTSHLLGSGLVGGAFGLGGQAIAEGANALQKSTMKAMPELGQLRRGGGDTDAVHGVVPGKEVAANIEAAREPIPGEDKPVLGATPTEVAAGKIQEPITEANAAAHKGLRERIESERGAMLESQPNLQQPVPARKSANAAVDWALSKLQPEARDGYLPGGKILSRDALPAADTADAQKLGSQLWKPRLVTSVEAASEARARGGRVITLDQARQLGIDPPSLKGVPDPETGVPPGAPPIPDEATVASPRATQAQAAGLPEGDLKVVLEPAQFDAKTFENIVGDIDRKAKAGSATAQPDPAWKQMQRAIREDRDQFGPEWSAMIDRHHEALNAVEQRSSHAGMAEAKPYSEMQGSSQQTVNGKLVNFPSNRETNAALRSLASDASPDVLRDLEVMGAQNAYSKLAGQASPRIGESVGLDSISGHLRGLGPAVRLRADAVARGVSRGPTGEPTVSPRIIEYVKSKRPSKFLPGMAAAGGGALGLKAGNVYNSTQARAGDLKSLTPEQADYLAQLLAAVDAEKSKGATP